MDTRAYLSLLVKRRLLLAATAGLAAAVALGASFLMTPTYEAQAKLLVIAKQPPGASVNAQYQGALLSEQLLKSFAEVLTSRPTLQRALARGSYSLDEARLSRMTHAEPIPDTLLIRLSVDDREPARARQLADDVARAFIAEAPSLQGASALQIDLVEPPVLPLRPVRPRTAANTAAGLAFGALLGLSLALFLERLDTKVYRPAAVEEAVAAAMLGSVPAFAVDKTPLPVADDGRSAAAEAFRKLSTSFGFLSVDEETLCCVVTSPGPHEGKSLVTANLAIALAQAGTRVAVLDADLRAPRVHTLLGLPQRVGTTSVLTGKAAASDALQPWRDSDLAVLTSGQVPPNPVELLSSHRMEELIGYLRKVADIVLVDAPPILPVTDPMVLARYADGVVLIARAGATTREQLAAAQRTCAHAGARVLGTVLNAAKSPDATTGSYYGYYEADA